VPTVAESGVPGYSATSWNAIAVPARTPRAVIDRLHREIGTVLALPDVRDKLAAQGVTARGGTPQALAQLLRDDIEKWRRVIDAARIERQ
jgi:tripartite-type tricarboxylate transporter receptor subunit TctC